MRPKHNSYSKALHKVAIFNKNKINLLARKRCSSCNSFGKVYINFYRQLSPTFSDKNVKKQINAKHFVSIYNLDILNYYASNKDYLKELNSNNAEFLIKNFIEEVFFSYKEKYSSLSSRSFRYKNIVVDHITVDIVCLKCEKQLISSIIYTDKCNDIINRKYM